METALAKLETFLKQENIIISVNQPLVSFATNGTLLVERSSLAVTYKQTETATSTPTQEVSSHAPTTETPKGATDEGSN